MADIPVPGEQPQQQSASSDDLQMQKLQNLRYEIQALQNLDALKKVQQLRELEYLDNAIALLKQKNELTRIDNEALRQDADLRQKKIAELEKEINLLKVAGKTNDESTKELIKELNVLKQIDKQQKQQAEDLKSIGGQLGQQLKSYFQISNIYTIIGNQIDAVAEANKEFARQTGQIADRVFYFGAGYSQFGLGMKELNEASISLYKSMSNFSELNNKTQEELAGSAAKLSLIGVSAEITANNLNSLTKAFGMTSEEAIRANEDLAKAAIGAGIAPSKMLAEFSSNLPRLAAYGKQAKDVFISLEKQAKSLGMEMSILTNIVGDQFDTFEGTARAAGRLNAVLGGNYLNSIEMLNATESERVVLLKQAFDASGKNFDSLDKYQKKTIAATLGIQDLNEASKLLSKSTTELTLDMQKNAASNEELEASQREAADIMSQLNNSFNGLLLAVKPLVEIIKFLVNIITWLNDKSYGLLVPLVALYFVFKKLSIIGKVAELTKKAWTAIKGFGAAAKIAAVQTEAAAAASSTASISIGELGIALAAVGAGLIEVGIGVLMIGAGIGLAFAGVGAVIYAMSLLVESVVKFFTEINLASSAKVYALAASITVLAGAIAMIPDDKVVTLTALNTTLTTAKSIKEEDIKPTKEFVEAVKGYYEVQAKSKDADKDALVAALKEVMTVKKEEEKAKSEKPVPIELHIEGSELADALKSGNRPARGLGYRFNT